LFDPDKLSVGNSLSVSRVNLQIHKAPICELEFVLSSKRVIGLIGTDKSCPTIVEINSNSIDGQTRPLLYYSVWPIP